MALPLVSQLFKGVEYILLVFWVFVYISLRHVSIVTSKQQNKHLLQMFCAAIFLSDVATVRSCRLVKYKVLALLTVLKAKLGLQIDKQVLIQGYIYRVQDKLQAHVIKLTFHSIGHRDIQEVCGSSRPLTALKFAGARWGAAALIDFLPDAKHLSRVEKVYISLTFSVRLHGNLHNC